MLCPGISSRIERLSGQIDRSRGALEASTRTARSCSSPSRNVTNRLRPASASCSSNHVANTPVTKSTAIVSSRHRLCASRRSPEDKLGRCLQALLGCYDHAVLLPPHHPPSSPPSPPP